MQPHGNFPRVAEPLRRMLVRNVTIALVVGSVFALVRHRLKLLAPVTLLGLWFSLGGHYIEIAILNVVRNRLPRGRLIQTLARLLTWGCAGALLFACMAATARLLPIGITLSKPWWFGSIAFIGVELAVHGAFLASRGLPNFYNGRG